MSRFKRLSENAFAMKQAFFVVLKNPYSVEVNGVSITVNPFLCQQVYGEGFNALPIIFCLIEEGVIVCNEVFLELPLWVQEAYVHHEIGHLKSRIGAININHPDYYLGEFSSDEYSQTVTKNMYDAMLYMYDQNPIMTDHKRLRNLEKKFKLNKRSIKRKIFDFIVSFRL